MAPRMSPGSRPRRPGLSRRGACPASHPVVAAEVMRVAEVVLAVEEVDIGAVEVAVRLPHLPAGWRIVTAVVLQRVDCCPVVSVRGWGLHRIGARLHRRPMP